MTDLLAPRPFSSAAVAGARRRRLQLFAAVLLPTVAVGGVVAASLRPSDVRRTSSAPATAAPAPLAAAAAFVVPVLASAGPAGPVRDVGAGPFTFLTPSRRTTCALRLTGASAECIVTGNSWSLPPKPADCEFDFGTSVAFQGSGSALTCRSDTFYDPAAEVVPYGTTVRSGQLACTIARTGVSCANRRTGERFTVSRTGYRLS